MKLDRNEVQHIALLARLGISEDEVENLGQQLSNILDNFEIMQQVDTTNLPPTSQSISLINILRVDISTKSLAIKDVLANAPRQEDNYFKVPAVFE